ncbi:MAG: LPS export ABC transporter periplasmic protein LptC [Saprospiraceae bacterium]|nr:LPS export ABC transporter periplasmic protein LptC [Saprospiraceae bacterium]
MKKRSQIKANSKPLQFRSNPTFYFLLFTFYFFLASCENDINEVNRLFSRDETQVETATGVELLYSDSAILKLRIVSPKLIRHLDKKDPYQEFPDGLTVEFFSPDGQTVTGRMTAKYAERYDNNSKFIVQDSVVWTGSAGERLETEELTWEEENDRVHTTKFVIVRRPDEIIYGHGFESNQKFTQWKIRAIEGRIKAGDITRELRN